MKSIVIGVDVGGTHTDAVALELNTRELLAKVKVSSTEDIASGIVLAVDNLFKQTDLKNAFAIMIGTTFLYNSLIERKNLSKVHAIRLAYPASTAIPIGAGWPERMRELLLHRTSIIRGGYNFSGNPISPLNQREVQDLSKEIEHEGISAAITGIFACVLRDQEKEIARSLKKVHPDLTVSCSHQLGGVGLLPRENTTILNAALALPYKIFRNAMFKAMHAMEVNASLYLSQGGGTVESAASNDSLLPIQTLNSGPTNSIRGAGVLAGLTDAVVVDVGGTTSDIGILKKGYPILENAIFEIEGVKCHFPKARTDSIALGGGTLIELSNDKTPQILSTSVGFELTTKALVFGGDHLTLTDIAVANGHLNIGKLSKEQLRRRIAEKTAVREVDAFILQVQQIMVQKLVAAVVHVVGSMEHYPRTLLLVGGGAALFSPEDFLKAGLDTKFEKILIPENSGIANAIGAAIGEVSGEHVGVFDFAKHTTKTVMELAEQHAKEQAIQKGADPSALRVTYNNEEAFQYLDGDRRVVTLKVAGPLMHFKPFQKHPEISLEAFGDRATLYGPDLPTKAEPTLLEVQPRHSPLTATSVHAQELADIALGAGILSSGGGGNTDIAILLVNELYRAGKKVQIVSFDDLPDDATVAFVVGVGSPTVMYEKLVSQHEGGHALAFFEKITKKKVDAIVTDELGGGNGIYHFFVGTPLGIPSLNGDGMRRAFPSFTQTTENIYGDLTNFPFVMANEQEIKSGIAKDWADLENKITKDVPDLGGSVTVICAPISGKEAKKILIPNSQSVARAIGESLRHSINLPFTQRLERMNTVLETTEHEKATALITGRLSKMRRANNGRFDIGAFVVDNPVLGQKLHIGFQNENLVAYDPLLKKRVGQVPDVITIVDVNTFEPLLNESLQPGQDVTVLHIPGHPSLKTEKALQFVGPKNFDLDNCLALVEEVN